MIELAPNPENKMTYEEALLYCQFLKYNGHSDWRMPTRSEYRTITKLAGWYTDNGQSTQSDEYPWNSVREIWTVTPVRDTTLFQYITHAINTQYARICTLIVNRITCGA